MRKNLMAADGGSIYLFALVGSNILGTIAYYGLARFGYFGGMSIYSWAAYVTAQIAFIAVVFCYGAVRKVDMLAVVRIKPSNSVGQYLLLVPIAIVAITAFMPLHLLFTNLLSYMGYTASSISIPNYSNAGIFILSVLIMAVIPAIGEELLMRGSIFSALYTRGTWFGIFISALLFSLLHQNPVQTAYQFCFGVVLAIIFMLSRSVVPCMVLHFLSNFIVLTVEAYIPQVDQIIVSLGTYNWITGIVAFVVGTLLLVLLLYFYYRAGKPRKEKHGPSGSEMIFEEYTITASIDETITTKKKDNVFVDGIKYIGSLFTSNGWRKTERELIVTSDLPYIGKTQPMLGVWLAVGLSAVYWVITLLMGLL